MQIAKITGGAGTQKTSHLIRQIEKDLQKYFIRDIAAISLTKSAVETIKKRLWHLGVTKETSTIGTIHSVAFSLIGQSGIADTSANIKKFSDENPRFSLLKNNGSIDNNDLFQKMQYYRNTLTPPGKWDGHTLKFFTKWQGFCKENEFIDFTGMLEKCIEQNKSPEIKTIYIDETQDQTPLATKLIQQWGAQCEKMAFYGDDDQTLYRFTGAVPESFINLAHNFFNNRPQSYRCPVNVLNYAMRIIKKCTMRIDKEYAPISAVLLEKQNEWRERSGRPVFDYTPGIIHKDSAEPDLSLPGEHMILTRANFQIDRWRAWLLHHKIPFYNPYRFDDKSLNPCNTKIWRALSAYSKIISGESITGFEAKNCFDEARAAAAFPRRGAKKDFLAQEFSRDTRLDSFSLLSEDVSEKFLFPESGFKIDDFFKITGDSGSLAKYLFTHDPKKLKEPPAVCLGTVHSVKGAEAENVWFDVGSTPAIHKSILKKLPGAFDDECRVSYVAATRARRSFGLLKNKMRNLTLNKI